MTCREAVIMIIIIIMKKNDCISTDELRFSFSKVLEAMKAKKKLTLTYRRKPLAIIIPYETPGEEISPTDPFYLLPTTAEPMGTATSKDIDKELYGR